MGSTLKPYIFLFTAASVSSRIEDRGCHFSIFVASTAQLKNVKYQPSPDLLKIWYEYFISFEAEPEFIKPQ